VPARLGTGQEFDEATGESEALNQLRQTICFDYALEDYVIGEVKDGWVKVPYANEPGGGVHDLMSRREVRRKNRKPKRNSKSRK
jgi:hypothetical protein